MFRYVLFLFVALGHVPAGWPQGVTLGDAARQAREQRKELLNVRETLVQQVLRISGTDRQLDRLPPTFAEGFNQQMAHAGPVFWEQYKVPPPASRTKLVESLDLQLKSAERTVDILVGMMKAMFSNMMEADPRLQQGKAAFLAGFEDGFRSTATPQFQKAAA